jgi:7,8-dihydro-6-hydroxymethylpterin-pyrophosphokinase
VDVLVVGDVVSDDPALTLPHPRAHERGFVLVPWLDADPAAVLPDGRRVAELVAALGEVSDVRRRDDVELRIPS